MTNYEKRKKELEEKYGIKDSPQTGSPTNGTTTNSSNGNTSKYEQRKKELEEKYGKAIATSTVTTKSETTTSTSSKETATNSSNGTLSNYEKRKKELQEKYGTLTKTENNSASSETYRRLSSDWWDKYNQSASAMQSAYDKVTPSQRQLESAAKKLQAAEDAFLADQSNEELYNAYLSAFDEYNGYVEQYQPLWDAYDTAHKNYSSYNTEYNNWRSSIRSAEEIQAEMDEINKQLKENKWSQWGLAYGGNGQAWIDKEKEQAELRKQYELLNEELNYSKYFYYGGLSENADFAKMSLPGESQLGTNLWQRLGDSDTQKAYDYINNIGDYQKNLDAAGDMAGTSVSPQLDAYGHMTEEQKKNFNYIYHTQGEEAAAEYLEWLKNGFAVEDAWVVQSLNALQGMEMAEGFNSDTQRALYGLRAGIDQFSSGVAQLFSEDAVPTSAIQYAGQAAKSELGDVGKFVYDAGMVTGNMLPSIALSVATSGLGAPTMVASAVGSVTLGASAGGNAYNQALKEGYAPSEAKAYGTLVGASEAVLQYALGGIGRLGGVADDVLLAKIAAIDKAWKRMALTGAVKIGSEVLEEELQEFIEPAIRSIIFDEAYDAPNMEDLIYTALLTAVTTGVMEGGSMVSVAQNNSVISGVDGVSRDFRNADEETIKEVIEAGLAKAESTEAHQLALMLQKKQSNGKEISSHALGTLYQMTAEADMAEAARTAKDARRQSADGMSSSNSDAESAAKVKLAAENAMRAVLRNPNIPEEEAASIITGYGEHGSRLFVELVHEKGMNIEKATEAMQSAYEMGFTDKLGEFSKDISNPIHGLAYNAGKQDALLDEVRRKENKPVIRNDAGFDMSGAPKDIKKSDRAFMELMSKAFAVKGVWGQSTKTEAFDGKLSGDGVVTMSRDLGISAAKLKEIGGAEHLNKIARIAKQRNKSFVGVLGHEISMHRVLELAPEEGMEFIREWYKYKMENSPEGAVTLAEKKRAEYGLDGKPISLSLAIEELAADDIINLYGSEKEFRKAMERIIKGENEKAKSGLAKYIEILKDTVAKLKQMLSRLTGKANFEAREEIKQGIRENERLIQLFEAAQKAALENVKEAQKASQSEKNTPQMKGEAASVKFSTKQEVLALDGIDWMDNFSSIKVQLQKHADEINKMDPVAVVEFAPKSAPKLATMIMDEVAKIGGKNIKRGSVTFEFEQKGVGSILAHAKTAELQAAALASPYVAKYGKLIGGQKNHENTGLTTLTYAAPVIINETPVNVGVVIQFKVNGKPRAVNVGLQSGGVFKIDMKKAPKGLDSRINRYGQGTALPTMDAYEGKVSQDEESVKTLYSKKDSESDSVQDSINQSMTMQQARDMVQRAFVLGGIKEWFEGEYSNGDEWLKGEGVDAVAMIIDNEWQLQDKYLNKIQGLMDEDFFTTDILEAYLSGTLTGKQKQDNRPKRLTTSGEVAARDDRFYAPKNIENAKAAYETAIQKVTAKNRDAVNKARAKVIIFSHTRGAAEALGITQSELNKKLRIWARYSASARETSQRFNSGVAEWNKWTGIENSNILTRATVSNEDLDSLVKEVTGDSDGWQRKYIVRTMLALDTHIDYSGLSFEFVGTPDSSRRSVNGIYSDSQRKIRVKYNAPNTVAHEMGHYLDYQWARDIGVSGALTDGFGRDRLEDPDVKQWAENFDKFKDSITDGADLYSSYTMDAKEVFARFVDKFVRWVNYTANGEQSQSTYVDRHDKFTAQHYIEFVRLLQEKSVLDGKKIADNKDVRYSKKDSDGNDKNIKDVSTGYAYGENYYTMSYTQDGKEVATLEYGEYEGNPNVKMIEVEPEYRRKGIATKLLQELQQKYPDAEINFGMLTPDGSKLIDSITYDVTDEAVVADRQKLKSLQAELDELQERLDVLYDTENLTEEQDAEMHRLGDRWEEVYNAIRKLSKELKGKKATRTYVKTDAKSFKEKNHIRYSAKIDTTGMDEDAKSVIAELKQDAMAAKYLKGEYASMTPERFKSIYRDSIAKGNPDYAAQYIAWVRPLDYIYATTTSQQTRDTLREEAGELDIERLQNYDMPIWLSVNMETGEIVGHEGRHRMLALEGAGVEEVAIVIKAMNTDRNQSKPIKRMRLQGQSFLQNESGYVPRGLGFSLYNALPISERYGNAAYQLFCTPEREGNIRYSIKGANANLTEDDKVNLQTAKKMREGGKSDEEIYKNTGWYTQSDGKWRTEIMDEIMIPQNFSRTGLQSVKDAEADGYIAQAEARFKDGAISEETYARLLEFAEKVRNTDDNSGPLSNFLDAPKLYEAYPQLKNVKLFFEKLSGMEGYTDVGLNKIVLDPDGLREAGQTVREGLAHEIQHIIQSIEGFTRGSTPSDAGSYEAYRKAGGEIEARDVESRLRMTAEERKNIMPERFSKKDSEDILKENEKLKEVNEALKAQLKRTKFATVDKKSLEAFTKQILKDYQSGADINETRDSLNELYTYIANGEDGHSASWETAYRMAYDTAQDILSNASILNDEMYQTYSDLRHTIRTTGITLNKDYEHDLAGYESLNEFRKANFGRIKIVKDGLPVDVFYRELATSYPEFFDEYEQSHPGDQLSRIEEVLNSLQPVMVNPYKSSMRESATWLANDIMERFFELPQAKPTFADKAERRLTEQKIKDGHKIEKLREEKNERIKSIIAAERKRAAERVAKEKADKSAKLKALKQKQRAKESKMSEDRKAKVIRERIMRHVGQLHHKLMHPTDKQHIPQELQGVALRLLESINLESQFEYAYGEDGKYHRVKRGEVPNAVPTKRTQAFAELKKLYAQMENELTIDPDLMGADGLLTEVIAMADKPIAEMNSSELSTVYQTIRAVEATISSANKMFADSRWAGVHEAAAALREDNANKKDKVEYKKALGRLQKLTGLDMETPETFFHMLGKSGDSIFRMMRNAQDEHIRLMKEIADFTAKEMDGVKVRKLESKLHKVTLGGTEVKLSTAQLMELYVLMRRPQAIDHIFEGGILPDVVDSKGIKLVSKAKPIRGISLGEVSAALNLLSAEEVAMAEKLQNYASTRLSEMGNAAAMKVYGYEKFGEKNYWTIRVNRQETRSDVQQDTAVVTLANRGFTKGIKPHANNSLRLGSIFDTFATHSSEMATYAAWLGTLEDINRIRNYTFRDENKVAYDTVKGIIDTVHGKSGGTYLEKLLADITNGVKGTHGETAYMSGIVGNFKAASVGANLRVIIQQPTAMLRALAMIGPRYLITIGNPISGWKKALKYAPIAQWKSWGYFDIATGRQMKDVLFDSDTALDRVKSASMWGAGAMDSLSWGHLWNACEIETKHKRKDLKPKTEEFYKAVAERFTEIVDHTQVVDGILQRSHIMRSADGITKMATAFMGEPIKQFNMMLQAAYDAIHANKGERSKAMTRLLGTAVALVISGSVNAMAQSIMDAVRDDDDEEEYWDKWLKALTGITGDEETAWDKVKAVALEGNIGNTLNPAAYIPYVKDILSILQGYDVSRMDMESIEKLVSAGQNMIKALSSEGKHTVQGAAINLLAEVARLVGVPVSNIKREVQSFAMLAALESDNYLMQYRMEKFWKNPANNSSEFIDILYNAYVNDKDAYKIMYEDMVKSGIDADKIKSGMESRMVKGQGVKSVSDLKQRYLSPTEQTVYDKTVRSVTGSGVWKKASGAQRDSLEEDIYNLTIGNEKGEDLAEKIDEAREFGMSETEYLLWKLALDVADRPNENGKLGGTPTNEEKANAIEMMGNLSDGEIAFLWDTDKGYEAYAAGVDMGAYVDYIGAGNDLNLDKLIGAMDVDIDTETYIDFREMLKEVDQPTKNGNLGSYTQAEAKAAIDAMPGLTREQRSWLYQSLNSSWKNNPYR